MRKQTKIAAVVSAAALLAIGASMTSFAATGWQEENGTWVYYDRDQNLVTNEWQKSGDHWFFLGDDGQMVTDSIVEYNDNYYYVDANGAMVANRWVELDNSGSSDDDAAPTVWYYFQSNGKAYKSNGNGKVSFKTINGRQYAFDTEAKMLYGWVDADGTRLTGDDAWRDGEYYLGDYNDGGRVSGSWRQIHVIDTQEDEQDQDYWFYFGGNGKKYAVPANSTSASLYEKTINGRKYTFDQYGKMLSEWVSTPGAATSVNAYKYFSSPEDGARKTRGWFRVVPGEHFDNKDFADDNVRWFYADGKGELYKNAVKTINGKKYAFDGEGNMISGLRHLTFAANGNLTAISDPINSEDKVKEFSGIGTMAVTSGKTGVYYFADEATDGSMQTGIQTISIDGDSYSYKFKTSGSNRGVGINDKEKDGYYVNGRKVKADTDLKFGVYEVNQNGRVVRELRSEDLVRTDLAPIRKSNGDIDYKGRKDQYNTTGLGTWVDSNGNTHINKVVVLTTNGSIVKSGTKKDGNDVKLVTKNSFLVGAYIQD